MHKGIKAKETQKNINKLKFYFVCIPKFRKINLKQLEK